MAVDSVLRASSSSARAHTPVPNFDSISMHGTPLFPNWYRLSRLRGVVQMPLVTVAEPRPARDTAASYAPYLLSAATFDPVHPMLYTVRSPVPNNSQQQGQHQHQHHRALELFDLPDHILYYLLMHLDVPSLTAFAATCRRAQTMAARVFSHLLARDDYGAETSHASPARAPAALVAHGAPYVPIRHAWLERRPRIYRLPHAHTAPVRVILADPAAHLLVTGSLDKRLRCG